MIRIDAHQHFWDPARGDYGWLTPDLHTLYRAFAPSDLVLSLRAARIDKTIVVQAAPTAAETEHLLALCRDSNFVVGVVGWVDLERPTAPAEIERRAHDPLFLGVRPMLQDIDDSDWILRPAISPALDELVARKKTFDALVQASQITTITRLAARYPDLVIILNHGGKPVIGSDLTQWAADTADLARCPNVVCKLSGLMTQALPGSSAPDLRPVVGHLIDSFGPSRLMWGSDWPVLTTALDYASWASMTEELLIDLSVDERADVFGGVAIRTYGISL